MLEKNPDYWDKGKPYLDGYRVLFVSSSSAQVAAIRGERAHIQFRGFSPADRDSLVQSLGPKITVQESPWDCVLLVAMNHDRKPFDDRRVRKALTLALDRHDAAKNLSRIAIVKEVAGIQVPGTPWVCNEHSNLHHIGVFSREVVHHSNRLHAAQCPLELMDGRGDGPPEMWAYHRDPLGVRIEIVSEELRPAMEQFMWVAPER